MEDAEYPVGTRVRLPDVSAKPPLNQPHPDKVGQSGVITSYEMVGVMGHEVPVPVITLDEGGVIRGYECWWEPEDSGSEAADGQ